VRTRITTLLCAASAVAVGLAACGDDGAGEARISAAAAKASIERSAQVKLAPESFPAEAREQGLTSAYTNAATAARDGQAVALFMLDDADAARTVGNLVRDSVPAPSRLIVNDNVVVVYAPAAEDRAAQIQHAVNGL
jgi:hypothetical protein